MKLKNPKLHAPSSGGLLHGLTGGRTDNMNIAVPHNSYIVPADVVSGLGEGNTNAGAQILSKMLGPTSGGTITHGSGPFGVSDKGKMKFASGGMVPIIAAAGEYHVMPDQVARLGKGNLKDGHRVLDKFVTNTRKKIAKKMLKLPGPKK